MLKTTQEQINVLVDMMIRDGEGTAVASTIESLTHLRIAELQAEKDLFED